MASQPTGRHTRGFLLNNISTTQLYYYYFYRWSIVKVGYVHYIHILCSCLAYQSLSVQTTINFEVANKTISTFFYYGCSGPALCNK